MPTVLGKKLKKLREIKGYTLEKLADLTSSSKSYIWELENKAPPRPSAEKLSSMATKLGVTIEYLLDDENYLSKENSEDALFYRNYQKMHPTTKEKMRMMVDLWKEDIEDEQ